MELTRQKKILIISAGQPSLNPRLVKEADALCEAGYKVTVLYAYWNDWGTVIDKELIATKKWEAVRVGGAPEMGGLTYWVSRLVHKIAKIVNLESNGKFLINFAIARSAAPLIFQARKIKADLYIGHNLGALPATIKAAKKYGKPCGFDAEDFHRNEIMDDVRDPDVILKSFIESRYIPQLDYLTVSSPLIGEAYRRVFPRFNPVVILNVFPSEPTIKPSVLNEQNPIRLFWFSQTVGPNRGIEEVISALILLKKYHFELHLLGEITAGTTATLLDTGLSIQIYRPIPPDEIPMFASQFDIGLATEKGIPLNRDICLTNKIFTYMLAGLAITASNTKAQGLLFDQYPSIGKVYNKGNPASLADVLLFYHQNRSALFEARKAAFTVAREALNWERESSRFLKLIDQTLNNY